MIKILRFFYAIPILPIFLIIAIKEYNNPWYSEGKVSEGTQDFFNKYKWYLRALSLIGWLLIINIAS